MDNKKEKVEVTTEDEELVEKLEELLALAKAGKVAECIIHAVGLREVTDDDGDGAPEDLRKKLDCDGEEFITILKKMEYGTKMVMRIKDLKPLPDGLVNAYNKLCKE